MRLHLLYVLFLIQQSVCDSIAEVDASASIFASESASRFIAAAKYYCHALAIASDGRY